MSGWNARPTVAVLLLLVSPVIGLRASVGNGALRVTLDETACRAVDTIGAYHVATQPNASGGRNIGRMLIGQSAVSVDCAWTLGDLVPGEYEIWFAHDDAPVAVRAAAVAPGQTTNVT